MSKAKGYLNIEVAYRKAVSEFTSLDPRLTARNSACGYHPAKQSFDLFFLNQSYRVNYPSGEVYTGNSEKEKVNLYLSTILLHYLVTSDGTPLSGEWITFKELPGGHIYQKAFYRRAQLPFLKAFGEAPSQFIKAAANLGGFSKGNRKCFMIIPVLPRVPMAFSLSPGDGEIAASSTILFDAKASSYLPTEDYAHLPGIVIREMVNSLG